MTKTDILNKIEESELLIDVLQYFDNDFAYFYVNELLEDMTAKELIEDNTNLYDLLKNSSDDDIIFSTESVYNIDFYDIVEDYNNLLDVVIKRLEDYNNDDLLNAYSELKN